MPLQLRDKSDFIPKLTVNANASKSNLFIAYSSSLQSTGVSAQIQTLVIFSPSSNLQWRIKIKLLR
jgi:hypothetical protein